MDETKFTKLADLNGLEVAPNVPNVSEIKDLPKNISKKSRLAFTVAFHYRQHPEEVNDESLNVVDLSSYLKSIATSMEESQPEMLDFLQSVGLTPQNYLEEMSDDEIKTVIKGWKTHQVDNEEYQLQCDEYLGYLLEPDIEPAIPEENNEVKEVVTPPVAENPETELKAESITIDESRLPYKLKAVILGKEKNPYFINLPPVAQVAAPEELQKYVEAFKQALAESGGKFYPRLAVKNKLLVVGIGSSAKRDTWKVVEELSAEELANITKKTKQEVEKYLTLRTISYSKLSESEQKERDDFEQILNNAEWNIDSSDTGANFKQAIKDFAILDRWIEIIGEERFKELRSMPLPAQPERNINRWKTDEEHFNSEEFQAKAKAFMELLKTRFDSLEKALGYKSILFELSQKAGLKGAEALYLLGKETLTGARQEFLSEYQRLYNLSTGDLKEYLKDRPLAEAPENETMTKAKVLKYSLLGYVRARPMLTDVWNSKGASKPKETLSVATNPNPKPGRKELKYLEDLPPSSIPGQNLFDSLSDQDLDDIFKEAFPKG